MSEEKKQLEDAPGLTPEDEQLLDLAWAKVAREDARDASWRGNRPSMNCATTSICARTSPASALIFDRRFTPTRSRNGARLRLH